MKKKLAVIALAGIMTTGLTAGNVQAAEPGGELYVFIAASLANSMEEIQKDFNQKYPDVEIFYNADSSGTLQKQIEEGSRCDIFFSAATKQMDALVEEQLAKEDSVEDLLENKVVLIKLKDAETKVTGFENITPRCTKKQTSVLERRCRLPPCRVPGENVSTWLLLQMVLRELVFNGQPINKIKIATEEQSQRGGYGFQA